VLHLVCFGLQQNTASNINTKQGPKPQQPQRHKPSTASAPVGGKELAEGVIPLHSQHLLPPGIAQLQLYPAAIICRSSCCRSAGRERTIALAASAAPCAQAI
jgi:hypothetical protein